MTHTDPARRILLQDGQPADLDLHDWLDPAFDVWAFDRRMDDRVGERFHLNVTGPQEAFAAHRFAIELRCQRLFDRRNVHSSTAAFDAALARHRRLHDLTLPLIRADYDHALDTWQWLLRIESDAGPALQLAALFHDVERLESEAVRRDEHAVDNYGAYKAAHAERGAAMVREVLDGSGFDVATIDDVAALIASHERRGNTSDRDALAAADALSFLSFNSPGYLSYYGSGQFLRKHAYSVARIAPQYRRWLESACASPWMARAVAFVHPR